MLSPGAILSPRRFFQTQSIRNHRPLGLGFPHLTWRYRPRGSLFSFRNFVIFTCVDLVVIRGCDLVLLRWGGTSTLARGALPAHSFVR